jgi:hypothetical protein
MFLRVWTVRNFFIEEELCLMATTGELRAIIEDLQLIDIGDAASYLGEEEMVEDDPFALIQAVGLTVPLTIEGSNGAGTGGSAQ